MRTNLKSCTFALMFLGAGAAFFSCSSGDDNTSSVNPPVNPVNPTSDEALSPSEQKEKLESVALELSNLVQASDFNEISSLGRYMRDTYGRRYDWRNVEDWARATYETMLTAVGSPQTEIYEGSDWQDRYITRNYNALVAVSGFKGHFTARNGQWVKSDANDLQFIFTDQQNRQCTLSLTTSGSTKDLHVTNRTTENWNYYYDENEEKDIYESIMTNTNLTVSVPQHIVVTLTQNGGTVVKASIDIDLNSLSENEFDIARSSLSAACKIELNNNYTFNLSQVAYTPNSNAAVSFTASKGSTTLVSFAVSATPSGIPSANLSALIGGEKPSFDNANGKDALVKVDVLGKVQVQGTLTDVRKFADYLNQAHRNKSSESTFKSYINQANSCMDINLFYDNNNVKQATTKIEAFAESDYYGTSWKAEPTLNFYDGSSYSTFATFFNGTDFRKVINAYSKLIDDFKNLVK